MAIELEPPYILSGTLSLIFIVFAIVIGLRIVSKYFEHKRRELLFVGLTALLISEPWWPSAFGFLNILITGEVLPDQIYFLMGVSLLPMLVLFWLTAFTDLLYKEKQKIILIAFAIYGALFEIFFLSFLVINPSIIGSISGYFDPNYGLFVRVYEISLLGVILITGVLFAHKSLKSDDPEIQLKGKFILVAIFSFIFGGALDIVALLEFPSPTSILLVVIARLILISCAVEFYIAFYKKKKI